jgi:1-acyl-sn-glycerol-3-phosphate acyltransferase
MKSSTFRFWRTALSLWVWFELGLQTIICFLLQLAIAPFVLPFDRNRFVLGRLFRRVAANIARFAPPWHFTIHGPYPARLAPKSVVVSNHVSHLDCFLISQLPYEMKWLAKQSLFRIPFLGWCMTLAGDIPLVRGASDSIAQAMQRCRAYLDAGMPIFIFPEGTRSTTVELLPFKLGAFRLAIEAGAEVVPLAVAGTRDALPKHAWRFGVARARVMVGQPIATLGMQVEDAGALRDTTLAQIKVMLAEIQPFTTQ